MKYLLAFWLVLGLSGCAVEDAVARAEAAVATAKAMKADADGALQAARETSAQLRELAKSLDAAKAASILAQADALVAQAEASVARVGSTLEVAEQATTAARAAKDAGGGLFEVLCGASAILLPGAAGAIKLLRDIAKARTAVKLTALHADRMEDAETAEDVEAAKEKAKREQALHGVAELIEKARS